jgi:hypothetical protein
VQIVAHPLEAVAGFGQRSGVMGKRAEGIDQIQQQTLLRQRIVSMPQAIDRLPICRERRDPDAPPR